MNPREPKFVLMGVGSRGDTNALMWLAAELVRRGRRCHLIGTEVLRGYCQANGVPLTVVAPAQRNNLVSPCEAYQQYAIPTYEPTYRAIEEELRAGENLVVVNRTGLSPATQCCEKYGLPQVRTYIAPSQMKSLLDPPWPVKRGSMGRLRQAFLRYHLPKLYEEWHTMPGLIEPLNVERGKLGLPPVRHTACLDSKVDRFIGFFPDWFGAVAPDWGPIDMVGFPVPDEGGELPSRFVRFVETKGRPLVFTPGTGVVNVKAFFHAAAECCRRAQRPGVFLSPHYVSETNGGVDPGGAELLHFDYLPLGAVLRHASVLVHHGGVGTTARALQAGVPQVVVPQAYDQPDNAARVTELGVGTGMSPSAVTGEGLFGVIQGLWADQILGEKLKAVAQRMQNDTAISTAADLLEEQYVS